MLGRLGSIVTTACALLVVSTGACAQAGKGFGTTDDQATSDAGKVEPAPEDDSGTTNTYANDSGTLKPTPVTDSGTGNETGPACAKLNNVCGVDPQCGCTSLETCDLDGNGTAGCIAAGTATEGRRCAGTASCARGLTCVFGTCHQFCSNAGSACGKPGTNQCYQVQAQGGAPVPNFKVCQLDCDLRDPNACGGTNPAGAAGCVHDGQGHTDCETAGTVPESGSCGASALCSPGLICVYPTSSPTNLKCKKWCRVGMNADCGGQPCTGFTTKAMVGTVEYGSCP